MRSLDVFRKPSKTIFEKPKKKGGYLFMTTVALWLVFVLLTIVQYVRTPDLVKTSVVPSSMLANNLALFNMTASFDVGRVLLLPKFGRGVCSTAANLETERAIGTTPSFGPSILCPASSGVINVGFDNLYNPKKAPNGMAFMYAMRNLSEYRQFVNMSNNLNTSNPASYLPLFQDRRQTADMFTVSTPGNRFSQTFTYAEGLLMDALMMNVPDGSMNMPVTTVTLHFQQITFPDEHMEVDVLSTEVEGSWVPLETILRDDYVPMLPMMTSGINLNFNPLNATAHVSVDWIQSDFPSLQPLYALNDTTASRDAGKTWIGFTGIGLVVLVASETTVLKVITSGRQPVSNLLGTFGGAFSAM